MAFRIRPAQPEDAPALAALAGQLGYPTAPEEMVARLQALAEDDRHAVFVAEEADGQVVGWIHVHFCLQVIADREAEIGGLVVDQAHRSRGIGARLVREAEEWARARGCAGLTVRANVVRERAHAFYRRLGFREVKVQRVFYRSLQEER
uniref:GCN5-related N-acetyltransferase n=1 Tax=uncultured prokaryote TaxID=198431 RepID=H5SKB6_9ZZZZ|nr:GCN5-related N-acetyltransferase [uncultured prokaryote]